MISVADFLAPCPRNGNISLIPNGLAKNVIFQYSIVTLPVVLVISVALGATLQRQITDYQIRPTFISILKLYL